MSNCFQNYTNIAFINISLNIFSKAHLILFIANKLFSFIDIKITC